MAFYNKPFRRSPRLRDFDYVGSLVAHVTLVTIGRRALFLDSESATACLRSLEEACLQHKVTVHAYCVMPDHVHLLAEIPGTTSLKKFIRQFKQLAGFRLKQIAGEAVWQISYYDRVLRKDEDLQVVADYIWHNPVKEGLVSDRLAYAWSGPRENIEGSVS